MPNRRWSLPGRLESSHATVNANNEESNNNNNNNNDDGGDVEIGGSLPRSWLGRRATTILATTPPPPPLDAAQQALQDEISLAIMYAHLNEAFGMDFGEPGGTFLVSAEVETVACTESSCGSQDGDGDGDGGENNAASRSRRDRESANSNNGNNRRSAQDSGRTYAFDPRTGLTLPVATMVPVPADIDEMMNDECSCKEFFKLVFTILLMFAVVMSLVFLLYIILTRDP